MKYILAIDQGTTSSRAILFSKQMKIEATSQEEFPQYFPNSGWVEQNPNDLFETVLNSCKNVLKKANAKIEDIVSIGITNQRETTIVWDKHTGEAIYNAIVWQDRRTAKECNELKEKGYEKTIVEKTGLLLDPYFSGMKLKWILENVDGAKQKAINGDLLFGTVDSFLIWKLSEKKNHVTDATNAARTMLFNIKTNKWDEEIQKHAQNWELQRLNLLDRYIIHQAMTEIVYCPTIPIKTSIDEYIEIAIQFCTEKSHIFINGLLQAIIDDYNKQGLINKTGRGLITN